MDEEGTLDAVGIPSLQESKTCTEPEQIASHLASTVGEPVEGPKPSHSVALMPSASSCWKGPVLEKPPTGVKNSDSDNLDPSSMRINYVPMGCEHRRTPTIATAGHSSTAQGAPQLKGMPDILQIVPSLLLPQ